MLSGWNGEIPDGVDRRPLPLVFDVGETPGGVSRWTPPPPLSVPGEMPGVVIGHLSLLLVPATWNLISSSIILWSHFSPF